MPLEHRQLVLPFVHATAYDRHDFLPAPSNRQAMQWLDADWPEDRLALWGLPGCGKSHLLHIWAERTAAQVLYGQTLGGQVPGEQTLQNLNALRAGGAVAIDDGDTVSSEHLLLHVLNTARDRCLQLLLSGRQPPARWPVRLPDLSSRLRSVTAVEIRPPDDGLLAALLQHLLSDRQLKVPRPIQQRLLARLPRSPQVLREAVARLDRASLRFGHAITRTLADRIIREAGFPVPDVDEVSMSGFDPSSRTPGFL